MSKESLKKSLICSLVFFLTSCITINIYFPAAAVEKAADRIVEEVWGEKGQKSDQDQQKKQDEQKQQDGPQSMLHDPIKFAFSFLGPEQVHAQEADINVTTPAIRALKESIQARADSIKPFMDRGNAGISNDGLLVVRNTGGLNLRDKANLSRLVDAENKDRQALYAEIARANNFAPDRISDIRKIFAGSWARNARPGWWIQGQDGSWKQK